MGKTFNHIEPAYTTSTRETTAKFPYGKAIVCLIFLMTGTCPDIYLYIGTIAQWSNKHLIEHHIFVKRVFKYIYKSRLKFITYGIKRYNTIQDFSDSDWVGRDTTRKETIGYLLLVAGEPGRWRSKTQIIVSTSSLRPNMLPNFRLLRNQFG